MTGKKAATVLMGWLIMGLVTTSPLLAADRLELDNTSIKGSRELPKVLYIVPWKESRIGTLAGVAEKGSFKDSMTALDRDLFLRELKYYNVLNKPEAVSRN
ncbi:MAG: hypothetical protein PVH04_11085 [Gammaproteobacteria bacterium]